MADIAGRDPVGIGDDTVDDATVAALVNLGVAHEAAAEYVRGGDPEGAVFDAVLLPGRQERTVTPSEIEAAGGMPVAQITDLFEAFGLPRPGAQEPFFTPEEARVLSRLAELDDLWPAELRVQVARASGALLAGIARAHVQAFMTYTEPHVRHGGGGDADQLRAVQSALEELLPLADPLLVGVHRRWLEHELAQQAVGAAEQRAGANRLPGAVEVTLLFCDLKDFTAYANTAGDAAAIAAIDRLFEVVAHERGDGGQFVKSLGDGAMLAYVTSGEAVTAGARVIVAMRSTGGPVVHASVHRGVAIARSGDYFGSAVNLAARLLPIAGPNELIATAEVVESCGNTFGWATAGEHTVRGVGAPLRLYRLASVARAATPERSPTSDEE